MDLMFAGLVRKFGKENVIDYPARAKHRQGKPSLIGDDEKVWMRYKGKGTHKGNAWGFGPTGKTVEFEGATILYINAKGKIVDRWGAFCFYDILTDLELTPPLWELSEKFNDPQI